VSIAVIYLRAKEGKRKVQKKHSGENMFLVSRHTNNYQKRIALALELFNAE
jgi:hypothetical protein